MHFAIANGSTARTLSANDLAAGSARVSYSSNPTCLNPAACGIGEMSQWLILPLDLTSFTGERTGASANLLEWETAQEQNSFGFYVERSADAVSFNETAFVAAAGNSNRASNYTFTDNHAGPHPWYYRLRMVDIDGKHSFSSTIFIDGDKSSPWKIWTDENGGRIYLYGQAAEATAELSVYSANGQQVLSRNLVAGSTEIDASFLSRGLYHYRLSYRGKVISGKLLLGSR
jgi:hypothetical protein